MAISEYQTLHVPAGAALLLPYQELVDGLSRIGRQVHNAHVPLSNHSSHIDIVAVLILGGPAGVGAVSKRSGSCRLQTIPAGGGRRTSGLKHVCNLPYFVPGSFPSDGDPLSDQRSTGLEKVMPCNLIPPLSS